MRSESIRQIIEYLKSLEGRSIATLTTEEESSDIDVAIYTPSEIKAVGPYEVLELYEDVDIPYKNVRFFVDGVQKTEPIWLLRVKNIQVPVHIIRVAAGAIERRNRKLYPTKYLIQAEVLAMPYSAIKALDPNYPEPPGIKLGPYDPIYEIIKNEPGPFWTDTSVPLRSSSSRDIDQGLQGEDLIRTGYVRRRARDRARVLMRILELGILMEIRKENPDEWTIMDGPVAPLLLYSGAVSRDIAGLQDLADKDKAYEFLRRVIGVVKRVQVVPLGLEKALEVSNGKLRIPVYVMSDVISQSMDDPIFRSTLVAFINLRHELQGEYANIWSPLSGLIRVDIPFPAFVPPDDPWYLPDYKPALDDEKVRNEVLSILYTILKEKLPIPPTHGSRIFTELYPIYEVERWLSATLVKKLI